MSGEKFELDYNKCLNWLAIADTHQNTSPVNWRGDHAFRSDGHAVLRHTFFPHWAMNLRASATTGEKYIDLQCGDSTQLNIELYEDNSMRLSLYEFIANVQNRDFRRTLREMFGLRLYSSNCLAPGWVYPTPVKRKPFSKAHLPKNKLMLAQPTGLSGFGSWSKIFMLNGLNTRLKPDRTIFSGAVDAEVTTPDKEKRKPLQVNVRALRGFIGMFRSLWEPLNKGSDDDHYGRNLAYWHTDATPDRQRAVLAVLEDENFSAQAVFSKAVDCAGKAREELDTENAKTRSDYGRVPIGELLATPEYYLMSRLMLKPSTITKLIQVNRVVSTPFLYLDNTAATPAEMEQRDRLDSRGD